MTLFTTPDSAPPISSDGSPQLSQALALLKQYWGYDSFLPLQEEAITHILNRDDTVVIMPTGAGKSLCYQLPALMMPGLAIVISPLISLMKDQVDTLKALGVDAVCLNSSMSDAESKDAYDRIRNGTCKLLYVSPERVSGDLISTLLSKKNTVSYVVVDEAHCVSQWGHDFRPAYRALDHIKQNYPALNMHAFTATATEPVQKDIIKSLHLDNAKLLIGDFERKNLFYRVQYRYSLSKQVIDILDKHPNEGGIIYCISRKDVSSLASELKEKGYNVVPYHAGLADKKRQKHQDMFLSEKVDIVVATVAFGMGIDRSNIRYVIHTGMPKSIEHYQQEAGRAGRDRLDAECTLLFSGNDVAKWRMIMGHAKSGDSNDQDDVALNKLNEMSNYCQRTICRHKFLVEYFGQPYLKENCGHCDACLGEYAVLDDSLLTAKKILSCVARVQGRFGAHHVAHILRGSDNEKVRSFNHTSLTTYGLLFDCTQRVIVNWIEQLIDQQFLARDPEYSTVHLSPTGIALLKNADAPENAVTLAKPVEVRQTKAEKTKQKQKRRRGKSADWANVDTDLFDKLRKRRKELADAKKVPAFVIFGDVTLREMAHLKPTQLDDFKQIKGVGETKLNSLCPEFLTVIQAHIEATTF